MPAFGYASDRDGGSALRYPYRCDNPPMRTVGSSRISTPSLLPTADALRAAAVHQAAGSALAALPTTGIECGVYRYATHEAMNRHTDEALARALAANARVRAAAG
jgi:hypothetical protein